MAEAIALGIVVPRKASIKAPCVPKPQLGGMVQEVRGFGSRGVKLQLELMKRLEVVKKISLLINEAHGTQEVGIRRLVLELQVGKRRDTQD